MFNPRPLALAVFCLFSLQGCVELAIGSAVVGTLSASDRRTFGAQTEDKAIVLKGESKLRNLVGNLGNVNISSFNRRALLTGEVSQESLKSTVEREIRAIEGVQSVVNELVVASSASLSSRSNDTLITGKVKAALVDARDINANTFKVVTENNTVFLMGRVTQREGNIAAQAASTVGGVSKVVKVLEYIGEDELPKLNTPPATSSN